MRSEEDRRRDHQVQAHGLHRHAQQAFDLVEAPEVEALGLPLLLRSDFAVPVVTHLVDLQETIVFTPNQVSLQSESGRTLDTCNNPRSRFSGHSAGSKWDKLHAGYFSSYALWGYLTNPFLFTYPGFEAHEIEPWHEDGERWRVLQVTFPDEYAAHTRTQYSYFGEDGLLRRHLYTVDVLGGAQGANYAAEYCAVDGVMVATRRRVVAYDDARQKVPAPVLVSIDLSGIHFE